MFGSGAIDVAIGLAFVFALLSLICSSLAELVSQLLGWRAQTLELGIRNLITDQATRDAFYRHPLIHSLGKAKDGGDKVVPSYIPANLFALVLLDVVAPAQGDQKPPAKDQGVAGELRRALRALTATTDAELEASRKKVEVWFDDVMDRASGWYKRKVQWVLLAIALVVTGVANADAINLAASLWQSPSLRASMVEAASSYAAGAAGAQKETLDQLQQRLDQLSRSGLPLGWAGDEVFSIREPAQWLSKIAGLLLTALAASLGAPFWFDLVNKLVNVRSTGNVPPRSSAGNSSLDQPDKQA
jgi:hypothetical protein